MLPIQPDKENVASRSGGFWFMYFKWEVFTLSNITTQKSKAESTNAYLVTKNKDYTGQ